MNHKYSVLCVYTTNNNATNNNATVGDQTTPLFVRPISVGFEGGLSKDGLL